MGGSSLKIYVLVVCMMYLDVKPFGAAGVCTVSLQWGLVCHQISRADGNQKMAFWLAGKVVGVRETALVYRERGSAAVRGSGVMGRGLGQAPATQSRACFFLAVCMSEVVCC